MDVKKGVGLRIKQLRNLRGYSQEKLSELVGISPNYLSNIERGRENPTFDLFINLSGGLNVEIYEIFRTAQHEEPKDLRKKLGQLLKEIREPELNRIVRILETLIH